MKIKIHLFLSAFLCLIAQQLISQPLSTGADNDRAHRRYWYYRTRFINDFTNIGGQQGDCICFPERNQGFTDNTAKVGNDQIDIMNQYLAALALEFKMLSRFNQSTQETLKEIFYILDTYNRLDSEADLFWNNPAWNGSSLATDHIPPQGNSNINGFMLREDMPHDYFKADPQNNPSYVNTANEHFKHFNYAVNEYTFSPNNNNSGYTGINKLENLDNDNPYSNYISFNNPIGATKLKENLPMVQEKFHSMFIAFMLLIKYIPDNTSFTENNTTHQFQDGQTDIKTEVRNITNRIHPYLRGNTFGNNVTDWTLDYPNGNSLSLGQFAQPWSYTNAKMICYINGGYPWSWPCNDFQDAISIPTGFSSYTFLSGTTGISGDTPVMLGYAQAGSNAPAGILPMWIKMDLNASAHSLEWMELLRKTLHQSGGLMKQLIVYADPINQAPCKGPFNFGNGIYPAWEWSSQDRNEHPNSRGTFSPFAGNYPGADYMLLHNLFYEHLYQLKDAGNLPSNYAIAGNIPTYNSMDNYDETTLPFVTTVYGQSSILNGPTVTNYVYGVNVPGQFVVVGNTIEIPANTKVFQNLTSRAQINPFAPAPFNTLSSKVEYRAGKEITLLPEGNNKPGFEVKAGSEFHAFVQRYLCSDGDYGYNLKQNPNQNNDVVNNDYETDEMNTIVPLHYVEYPRSSSDLYPQTTEEDPSQSYADEQQQLEELLIEKQNAEKGIYNTNKNLDQRFLITPNPNNGVFTVYVNKVADDEVFSLSIIDMKGTEIKTLNNINVNLIEEINLTEYSKGIYLVKLFSNKGFNATKKISVN